MAQGRAASECLSKGPDRPGWHNRALAGRRARPGPVRSVALNVLAHALLAQQSDCSLIGNLLGDFVRGAPPLHYPPAWQNGIRLHRRIDGFVDRHAASACSVARLPARQRRWARVALDVYYDHLLACDWARYSNLPLAQFAASVYAALDEHSPALPPSLVRFAGFMAGRDLLAGYRDPQVIAEVLAHMAGRVRRPNTLAEAFPGLVAVRDGIAQDFSQLFPATLAFARSEVAGRALQPAA